MYARTLYIIKGKEYEATSKSGNHAVCGNTNPAQIYRVWREPRIAPRDPCYQKRPETRTCNRVYIVAAYHDLGMSGPRAIHHLTSGKILQADARLKRWFNAEQIKIMKEAVEDHRASSSRQPRSIYGKIVAEADRDIDVHEIFLRAIEYGKENYPEKDKEEQWKRFSDHMDEKYSRNGYIKLWIPNSPNEKALKELRNIIDNKAELRKHFEEIYEELKKKGS